MTPGYESDFDFNVDKKGDNQKSRSQIPSEIDWERFKDWLNRDHSNRYVRDLVSNARKYGDCLFNGDLGLLVRLSRGQRKNAMCGLAAFSKYLGLYDKWQRLRKKYDLKWNSRNTDEIMIDRLVNVQDPDEIFDWIKKVKTVRPELTDFMDLISLSGMRLVEAVKSYNLIIKLIEEGKLDEYYNEKKGCLEHYKFKDQFLRKTKKAFISFIPYDVITGVAFCEPLTVNAVQKRLQRAGIRSRFSDIRELHASYLVKYLSSAEIDFLHGRVSASVFMRNYFNPEFVDDLKTRLWKAIKDIKQKIS